MSKQIIQKENYYETYQIWEKNQKASILGGIIILGLLIIGLILCL